MFTDALRLRLDFNHISQNIIANHTSPGTSCRISIPHDLPVKCRHNGAGERTVIVRFRTLGRKGPGCDIADARARTCLRVCRQPQGCGVWEC